MRKLTWKLNLTETEKRWFNADPPLCRACGKPQNGDIFPAKFEGNKDQLDPGFYHYDCLIKITGERDRVQLDKLTTQVQSAMHAAAERAIKGWYIEPFEELSNHAIERFQKMFKDDGSVSL